MMHSLRIPAALVALLAGSSLAVAADLRVAPAYKAPPAMVASPLATGYVEIYGGWSTTRFDCGEFGCFGDEGEKIDGWVLGGAGRGNYWFAPNMSVQFDAQGEGTSYSLSDGPGQNVKISGHSYLVGGHLNWRDSQRGLFGIFAGAGDVNSARNVLAGAEAQLYWNQMTFYAQAGYNTTVDHFLDVDAWFGRLTGRYFINPNLMIEATGLYARGEIRPSFDIDGPAEFGFNTWMWEAKAEWRMPTHPFSLFFKYTGSQTEYDNVSFFEGPSDLKVTDHRFLAGFKLFLGDNTLMATDRKGATLDMIAPLGAGSGPLGFGFGGPGIGFGL